MGFIVDDSLSLEEHVNSISKSCYYHIRRIAKIQKYLSEDSTAALVHAFITCRLDNGNALLYLSFDFLSGEGKVSAVHSVEGCASEIDEWMRLNKLKLNRDKSELLVISSKYRPRPSLDSISISGQVVKSSA